MVYGRLLRHARVLALMLPLAPSTCATTTGSEGTDVSFCGAARAILWSKSDTDGTIEQVKEHNAVGKRICGWGTKKS